MKNVATTRSRGGEPEELERRRTRCLLAWDDFQSGSEDRKTLAKLTECLSWVSEFYNVGVLGRSDRGSEADRLSEFGLNSVSEFYNVWVLTIAR